MTQERDSDLTWIPIFRWPKQNILLQLGIYENLFVYLLFAEVPQGVL